jgi:hypothetical protein
MGFSTPSGRVCDCDNIYIKSALCDCNNSKSKITYNPSDILEHKIFNNYEGFSNVSNKNYKYIILIIIISIFIYLILKK